MTRKSNLISRKVGLSYNSVYVSAGTVIRLIVNLASLPVLVRLLGLERYGIWSVLIAIVGVGELLDFGLSTALTSYLAADYAREDWVKVNQEMVTSWLLITLFGSVAGLWLLLFAPIITGRFFPDSQQEAVEALRVLSWLPLLLLWQKWAMAIQAALLRYDLQAMTETSVAVFTRIGAIVVAFVNRGSLIELSLWFLFVNGIGVMANFWVVILLLRRYPLQFFCYSKWAASNMLRFGIAHWLSALGSYLFGYVDRILVNYFLGPTITSIYSVATSVVIQINVLSAAPLRVLLPVISAANAKSQTSRILSIFIRGTRFNGMFVFLLAAPIIFWAKPLARVLIGQAYATEMVELLRILGVLYGLYSLNAVGFFTAIGMGRPIINTIWSLIGGILTCILMAVLSPNLGATGAVWANSGYLLTLMINLKIFYTFQDRLLNYLKALLPSVVCIIAWWKISAFVAELSQPVWLQIVEFLLVGGGTAALIAGKEFLRGMIAAISRLSRQVVRETALNVPWKGLGA